MKKGVLSYQEADDIIEIWKNVIYVRANVTPTEKTVAAFAERTEKLELPVRRLTCGRSRAYRESADRALYFLQDVLCIACFAKTPV